MTNNSFVLNFTNFSTGTPSVSTTTSLSDVEMIGEYCNSFASSSSRFFIILFALLVVHEVLCWREKKERSPIEVRVKKILHNVIYDLFFIYAFIIVGSLVVAWW